MIAFCMSSLEEALQCFLPEGGDVGEIINAVVPSRDEELLRFLAMQSPAQLKDQVGVALQASSPKEAEKLLTKCKASYHNDLAKKMTAISDANCKRVVKATAVVNETIQQLTHEPRLNDLVIKMDEARAQLRDLERQGLKNNDSTGPYMKLASAVDEAEVRLDDLEIRAKQPAAKQWATLLKRSASCELVQKDLATLWEPYMQAAFHCNGDAHLLPTIGVDALPKSMWRSANVKSRLVCYLIDVNCGTASPAIWMNSVVWARGLACGMGLARHDHQHHDETMRVARDRVTRVRTEIPMFNIPVKLGVDSPAGDWGTSKAEELLGQGDEFHAKPVSVCRPNHPPRSPCAPL